MVKVFMDLDGVFFDFDKAFVWDEFCKDRFSKFIYDGGFETLELMPNAQRLIDFLKYYENLGMIEVEVLSSLGTAGNSESADIQRERASAQKMYCMEKHGIGHWKANFVAHKGLKKLFATPYSILVDDTNVNIYDFEEHHGYGVLWKDTNSEKCLDKLENLIVTLTKETSEKYRIITNQSVRRDE